MGRTEGSGTYKRNETSLPTPEDRQFTEVSMTDHRPELTEPLIHSALLQHAGRIKDFSIYIGFVEEPFLAMLKLEASGAPIYMEQIVLERGINQLPPITFHAPALFKIEVPPASELPDAQDIHIGYLYKYR